MRAGNNEKLQETLYADSLEVDKKIGLTWRLALRQPAISSAGYYRHYPQVTLVTCINTRSGRILSLDYTLTKCRSEEHTSELQSPMYLVCRLLLEKKKSINH